MGIHHLVVVLRGRMEDTFIISGGRKIIKKPSKSRPLPEIFVEREDNNNLRFRQDIRQSTPYHNEKLDKIIPTVKEDSGYQDWSASSSRYEDVSTTYASVASSRNLSAEDSSLWESIASPVMELKKQFKSRPTFVEERPKIKFSVENLVKVVMFVVLFSSIGFSLFVGMLTETSINGKLKAVKYGTEKKILALKNESRIIDFDIKDEFGNVLGGKKAAIQFAYDMMQKANKDGARVKRDIPTQEAASKPAEHDVRPQAQNKVEATVEDPVPLKAPKKGLDELSIYELTSRIEQLNNLLKDEDEGAEEEFETIDNEIKALRLRKRNLIKKLQKSEKAKAKEMRLKAKEKLKEAGTATEPLKEVPRKPMRKVKPPTTKVNNPLTGDLMEPKQSKPKNRKKKDNPVKEEKKDDPIEDDKVMEDEDYPDDPTFRDKREV